MNDRSRGVLVYPMPEEVGGPAVLGRYALLVRGNGEIRMVHTEGVAYKVTDSKPWCWTDYDPNQRSWRPIDLVGFAVKEDIQPVDLADWVRTHNDRLESNFHQIWWWATEDDRQEAQAEIDAQWRDVEAGEQHLRDTNRD